MKELGPLLAIGGGWLIAVLLAGHPSLIIAISALYGFGLVFAVGYSILKKAGSAYPRASHVQSRATNLIHVAAIVAAGAVVVGLYCWVRLPAIVGRPWLEASLYQFPSMLLGVAIALGVLGIAQRRKAKL